MKKYSGTYLDLKEDQIVDVGRHSMTIGTLTRWCLLMEALGIIMDSNNTGPNKVDEETITKKAKQHKAITSYINERYSAALVDVIKENNF